MLYGNYDNIVEKISKASGIERGEIERRIEAKRAKLSNLISKEGAAQVVASELGISFDNERLKVSELLPGMKRVNLIGKIISISPVREFNKNNRQGKVVNLVLADETGNIRTVLWDTNHINLIEKGKIRDGDVVEILNANVRDSEIHLTSFSDIKLSSEVLEEVKTQKIYKEKSIEELRIGESAEVRAWILQVFKPRFFEVCPECSKRPNKEGGASVCPTHGKIIPEKRVLLNLVLDDGTESIRAVMFNEAVKKLIEKDIEDPNSFMDQREELLGKEMFFSGDMRKNKLFNNAELIIEDIKEIDVERLIKELEK